MKNDTRINFENFLAFARSKGKEEYEYENPFGCAFAQFLESLGYKPAVGPWTFGLRGDHWENDIQFKDVFKVSWDGLDFSSAINGYQFPEEYHGRTFDKLAERLELFIPREEYA